MRIKWLCIAIVAITASVTVACDMGSKVALKPQLPANVARVVIPLPDASTVQSIGLDNAREPANYYQVFFRKTESTTAYYSSFATVAEGRIEIEIPVGTYDILLIAGHKRSNDSNPLLLASSYVLSRDIVSGKVNRINMVFEAWVENPYSQEKNVRFFTI